MKQSISKLGCSLLLSMILCASFAQVAPNPTETPVADTTRFEKPKKPDSLKEKFNLRAIRIGADLIPLIKTTVTRGQPSNLYSGWEVNADVDLGKFYFAVDVGHWGRSLYLHYGDNGSYTNNGTYYRAGLDINLLRKDPDRNMFFFGFRVGHSSFVEEASLIVLDPNFGLATKELRNNNVTATWGELTTGLRVKVWKEFWMGYTARMKFLPSVSGEADLKAFDIPGYGLNGDGFYWGFNYQIFYRIPLRKEKKPVASK